MASCSFILAFETSTDSGSVALLNAEQVILEIPLEAGLRHGTALMPAARDCLMEAGLRVNDLACVAVDIGPGSYTGTRISVMAAKTLAFAAKIKLVGVSSLAGLAFGNQELGRYLVTVLESRRDEVYAGIYEVIGRDNVCETISARTMCPEQAAKLAKDEQYVLVGKGVWRYVDAMRDNKAPGALMDSVVQVPAASTIGKLAWQRLQSGQSDDPFELQPLYYSDGYVQKISAASEN